MSEMVERVAKAMAQRSELSWDRLFEPARNRLRADARAAIEAMREPTDAMKASVDDYWDVDRVWLFMIDAALKEDVPAHVVE